MYLMEPEYEEPMTIDQQLAAARQRRDIKEVVRLTRLRDIAAQAAAEPKAALGCSNPTDPFTTRPHDILRDVIVITQNGKNWCFDLISLAKQLFYKSVNPYTRAEFSPNEIKRILAKAQLHPTVIAKRSQLASTPYTVQYADLRYSNCEQDIISDLQAYNNKALKIIRYSDGYLQDLYNLYHEVLTVPIKKLNRCSVTRNPSMVMASIKALLEHILEIV